MKINKKGVTLIELLIVLAILGIALSLGFSFSIFGMRTFDGGINKSEIQFDARMVSKFLTDELRNAISLELIDIPASFTNDNFNYIYIINNTLVHRYNGVVTNKTGPTLIEVLPTFVLTKLDNDNNTLSFDIKSSKTSALGQKEIEINSTVQLNNLTGLANDQDRAVKYKKP